MPHPEPIARDFSFTGFQTTNPTSPPPGNKLDSELDRAMLGVNDLLARLKLIQRDDGKLGNATVGLDQLTGGLLNLIVQRLVQQIQNSGYRISLIWIDEFTGDGVTSTFPLSVPVANTANAIVTISGVIQAVSAYGITTSGSVTNLTFVAPPPNGAPIEVRVFDGFRVGVDSFVGNGTTTQFTMSRPVSDPSWIAAIISGVWQHTDAFQVNGNRIIFAAPPPEGVAIEVRYFRDFVVYAEELALLQNCNPCCEC